MTVPVIWNASAGQKVRGPLSAANDVDLRRALADAGLEVDIVATRSEEEANSAIEQAIAAGAELIIAAGGDGTIGRVAEQLLGTGVTLGIMPLGSVMNIPRMLGLPRDIGAAAQAIAAGRTATIDVGMANGTIFFETASVGLNAAVFAATQHFEDGDWGSPFKAIAAAFRYQPARMAIALDNGEQVTSRALMVTASNGAYTGVGMTVAPGARLDDGRFDVRVFRNFSKLELLRHLTTIMFGRRTYSPKVSTYRSATVRIDAHRPLPSRADSHDLGTTPLECRVRPASLKTIVGPDYADGSAVQVDARS